jgi:hypothetical protein
MHFAAGEAGCAREVEENLGRQSRRRMKRVKKGGKAAVREVKVAEASLGEEKRRKKLRGRVVDRAF